MLLLIVLLCTVPNAIMLYLAPRDHYILVVDRNSWDADPPNGLLEQLKLPVKNIIVTHSADELNSCTTQVRFMF